MRRNQKEIDTEIVKLQEIKPKVLKESMFGDNHHDAIDGQIRVLKDDLSEDNINFMRDDGDITDSVAEAMHDAVAWVEGDYEYDTLVHQDTWLGLVRE